MKSTIKIPILTYHSIDESRSVISTSLKTFQRQMEHLKRKGMRVVSLASAVGSLAKGGSDLGSAVVLTFDDGFQNFYTRAFPVLERYGFTATVFPVTGYCGRGNEWENGRTTVPREKLLSWAQIRELGRRGVDFGSHTLTHPDLVLLSLEGIHDEMSKSRAALEDALGKPVTTFAYPYGSISNTVKDVASEYFRAACSTVLGKATDKSDRYSLERIDAYYLQSDWAFESLTLGSFDRYLRLRQILRDFKGHRTRRN